MKPADRLAIVTGTSSGIGAAVAALLIQDGWSVVGLSRRPGTSNHERYRHVPLDLADLAQLTEAANRELAPLLTDSRWQRVGLVNNAAAGGALRSIEDLDLFDVARVFAVNTVAPIFLMGLVVRLSPPASGIRIVNVSSGAAVRPFPGGADYGSSKAALRLAGMTLAAELASPERPGGTRSDVAILSYSPGVVDTPMQESARAPGRQWNRMFVDFHAHGHLQPPLAPAREVVRFLMSDGGEPVAEGRFPMERAPEG